MTDTATTTATVVATAATATRITEEEGVTGAEAEAAAGPAARPSTKLAAQGGRLNQNALKRNRYRKTVNLN